VKRLKIAGSVLALAMLTASAFAQPRDDRKNDNKNNTAHQQQQRPRLGDWIKEHKGQPPQEQKKALQNDPRFKSLPPDTQQRYIQRLDQFNSLPPERQQHVLNNMERWNQLSQDQRNRAKSLFTQFRLLPLDRKRAMRQAFSRLHVMTPQQRDQAIDSTEFKNEFNDNERDLLRGMSQLNIGPAHEADENGTQPPPQ
jgi:Protein of unknown function (DUF3106)